MILWCGIMAACSVRLGSYRRGLREFAAGLPTAAGLNVDSVDAADELIALGKAAAVVDGVVAAAMARYDHLNAGSPAAILVQHAGFTRTAADNLRRLGRKLDTDLPATRAQLAGGRIGTAAARTIAALDDELAAADTPVPESARRQVDVALAATPPAPPQPRSQGRPATPATG